MPSYDRPTDATLHVRLANGETWEATPEDLDKFGYVKRLDAYMAFDDTIHEALNAAGLVGRDVTDARINPIRYVVETAVCHPSLLTHPEFRETVADLVEIERRLQATTEES